MSLKESKMGRGKSHKKSKTQKFVFPQKDNHITIKATSLENQNDKINTFPRHTIKFGKENIKISPFNSYNFKNELILSKVENNKNQETKQTLDITNEKRKMKFSPKKNTLFNSLNKNFTKTINSKNSENSHAANKYLFPKKNKNYINFLDRNKIRNIKLTSLNIFNQYIDEKVI